MGAFPQPSFNWVGFASAMGSNLTFQSRNVLSKKLMQSKAQADKLDNISLFCLITLASSVLLLPFCLLIEGWRVTPAGLAAMVGFKINFCTQLYDYLPSVVESSCGSEGGSA